MQPDTLEKVLITLQESNGSEGKIYFAKFDTTVRLVLDTEIEEYNRRCIEFFLSWQETVLNRLQMLLLTITKIERIFVVVLKISQLLVQMKYGNIVSQPTFI